ncbi:NAD(P)-dependent oxidoreductase [Amycolatopsis pithecellobii]|uniref:NAD-binding protein n=1 Tax=Amycolatopsis pithecellobii TaxID=664692 RepID=A0A6N7Z5R1_9PSEU|nr:NAD(P)-dependent oxidoreductase [Amycolatopsis pithecellobii]MTD56081.1 NAD-binding protein [Amycolatopsis pithecellobii]
MIGLVGLGNIGSAMARRLVSATGSLTVWNRSAKKAAPLAELGAFVAESPEAVFDSCDVIGICVTSHVASGEIARRMFARTSVPRRRRVLVDLSTGSPEAAADLAREADAHGIGWVDSPVSGGTAAAAEGKLTLFMGGAAADIEAAAPLLDALSARKTLVGGPGAGQAMKLCNQMIVASNIMAIAETISAARRTGIPVASLPDALFGGFADSPPLRILGPRMVKRDHEPRFGAVGLMEKDLLLARAMMLKAGAWTPSLDNCIELCARIDGSADISSLVEVFDSTHRKDE